MFINAKWDRRAKQRNDVGHHHVDQCEVGQNRGKQRNHVGHYDESANSMQQDNRVQPRLIEVAMTMTTKIEHGFDRSLRSSVMNEYIDDDKHVMTS